MPFIQFRIHPSVGVARMGDSPDVYSLGSDIPQYMQEEMPELRYKPRPRTTPPVAPAGVAPPASFKIFDDEKAAAAQKAKNNMFKDKAMKVIPQAARFRVFAYVYSSRKARYPRRVFEVTSEHADIKWSAKLANLKGEQSKAPKKYRKLETQTAATLDTSAPEFRSTKIVSDIAEAAPTPTLGYAFLERKKGDSSKVNGRLHLIGNEGEITHYDGGDSFTKRFSSLWYDDCFDSQADGPVNAEISPKDLLFDSAGVAAGDKDKLKSLSFGTEDPQATDGGRIAAIPAWAVVGLPNYTPDMAHFVSMWDLGLSNAINSIDSKNVKKDPTHHKMIRCKDRTASYRRMDYAVNIHPQLCLFRDVNWTSGSSARNPGHNETTPEGTANAAASVEEQVEKGGIRINPRDDTDPAKASWPKKADLAKKDALTKADPAKKINDWVKVAIVDRLRPPDTLYLRKRRFYEEDTKSGSQKSGSKEFPRHLGRRPDYVVGKGIGDLERIGFPRSAGTLPPDSLGRTASMEPIPGSLKKYHTIVEKPGRMCGNGGRPKLKPGKSHPAGYSGTRLEYLDDMYWPINNKTMPLLRELAYTHVQYEHFKLWSGKKASIGETSFLDSQLSAAVKTTLNTPSADPDQEEALEMLQVVAKKLVPSMIDMAAMETILGGSFLPGIEVGLEAGRRQNWALYHGANSFFPDVRFERSFSKTKQHFAGRLTKDLAIPWQADFVACLEEYWPTSRPGVVHSKASGARKKWMIDRGGFADTLTYYSTYWKKLGFMRRQADDRILEDELS